MRKKIELTPRVKKILEAITPIKTRVTEPPMTERKPPTPIMAFMPTPSPKIVEAPVPAIKRETFTNDSFREL